ncbi:MAG: ASPIC/UnbV domain-containing protein, partial [Blastocatellia bacterium]
LSLTREGTRSNRNAIGARVTLRAGSRRYVDEVRAGGSYLSHSDRRLHFGLGSATHVDEIEIQWPSGTVETLPRQAVNQFLTLREPAGENRTKR